MKKITLALLALFFLSACGDDDDTGGGTDVLTPNTPGILIGIEGTSPNGISSLASYNRTAQTIENNIFRKANINPMGSQLSDIMYDADLNQLVLVIPGSERLTYIDATSFEIKRQVNALMLVNNVAKARDMFYYVSSNELDGIYVINAERGNIREEIMIPNISNPTEIKMYEDMAFICNTGDVITKDSTITIMRNTVDTLITTFIVGHSPNSIVFDEENQMHILCSGDFNIGNPLQSGVGSLWTYNIDTVKMAIDSGFAISPDTVRYFTDNQLRPNNLNYDVTAGNLFYVNGLPTGAIAVTNKNRKSINENVLVDGNFYGIAFDDANLELYGLKTPSSSIEDNGWLDVYDPVGNPKVSIRIGVKPNNVVFK